MDPKVLVTGHPNSGTSFLCELVAAMGFSPGDPRYLKPADDHNPHGYWEHMPLQEYVRALSGYGDWMHITGGYPPEPLTFDDGNRWRLALLAEGAEVEIFKETGLPMMYRLFPPDSKYLIITRRRRAMYESRGGNYQERGISFDEFCDNLEAYEYLTSCMTEEVECLTVRYEDFIDDMDTWLFSIASFLGVKPNIARLREVWRPRVIHAK
jgi:hypothetical protein